MTDRPSVLLSGVGVKKSGRWLLDDVSWDIMPHERWVVFGANGAGKTTLLQVVSTYQFPTRGRVTILGETLGRTDVRNLRPHIGYVGPAPTSLIRQYMKAREIVVTGKNASFLETRWGTYCEADWEAADRHLETLGASAFADRQFETLSEGERKRVLIARALMTNPSLLLMDESTSGLDLGSREALISRLGAFAQHDDSPPTVLVTHHVEEIPLGFDNALLLDGGHVVAAGPIGDVLTSESLSDVFGTGLRVERVDGRFRAWAG